MKKDCRLVHGNELLEKKLQGYNPEKRYKQTQHTVRHVLTVMRMPDLLPPRNWPVARQLPTALDVFVGYILFDAWIGNTDRHHQNWGFISEPGNSISLAPSFDHASSLGRELLDNRKAHMLASSSGIRNYFLRGRSAFYSAPSFNEPLGFRKAFESFAASRSLARKVWLGKLLKVDMRHVERIISYVPDSFASPFSKDFALELLIVSRDVTLHSNVGG